MNVPRTPSFGSNAGSFREPTADEVRSTVNSVCGRLGLLPPTDLHVEESAPVARRSGRAVEYGQYTRFVKWSAGRAEAVGNRLVDSFGFTALRLTALATSLATLGAVLAILDQYVWAAVAIVASGAFEAVDAVAARRSTFDRRDVFLDYVSDRLSDIMIFGAVAWSFLDESRVAVVLSAFVLLVSLVSSYSRSQAEALRFRSTSRFGRMERVVGAIGLFAGIGLLGGTSSEAASLFATWMLAAIGALTLVTLVERIVAVLRSADFVSLDVAADWEEGSGLPRLLQEMMEANERLTVYESTTESQEIGQLIHIRRTPSGNAVVTMESGVSKRQLRRRKRAS